MKKKEKKPKLVDLIPGLSGNSGPQKHGKPWQRSGPGGGNNTGPKQFTHKATHK